VLQNRDPGLSDPHERAAERVVGSGQLGWRVHVGRSQRAAALAEEVSLDGENPEDEYEDPSVHQRTDGPLLQWPRGVELEYTREASRLSR